jgi:hypothetical protein
MNPDGGMFKARLFHGAAVELSSPDRRRYGAASRGGGTGPSPPAKTNQTMLDSIV